jgi:hypothetical protein
MHFAAISALLVLATSATGQHAPAQRDPTARTRPVWVYFADSRATPTSTSDTVLSAAAIERRRARRTLPGLFDRRDVALDASLVRSVASTGARVRAQSRWLSAVSADATPSQVAALASLPGVVRIEPVRRGEMLEAVETAAPPSSDGLASVDYGVSTAQLAQIDIPRLHERGHTGAGIIIGVLDTGFNRVHEAFTNPSHPLQVLAEWDFINNDGNTGIEATDPATQHKHGTWILGTIGAYLPGTVVGGAFDARFVLAKTEDVATETPIEEDYYAAGIEFIEAHGADLATSSLGYIDWYTQADLDGATAVTTIAVNLATANGMICVTAAGNSGHDADPITSTLIAPADALDVITCGATDVAGVVASFSSSGPTADGRVKPEVLARGVATATVHSTNATGTAGVSGTSLSTPLVAAAIACILDARPDYSVAQLREALFATASRSDSTGLHPDPLFVEGHGLISAFRCATLGRAAADLNLDGTVDGSDLTVLISRWGVTGTPGDLWGDISGDGVVDGLDATALLSDWG